VLWRQPDLRVVDLRGNVETRLRKLAEQDLDGILLAQAGLQRLGLEERIAEILDPQWMLPAVGQGALGLECRADDSDVLAVVGLLNDNPTRQAVLAERALLRDLGGGCLVPVGAAAAVAEGLLRLRAAVLSPDGSRRVTGEASGPAEQAEAIGIQLANTLRAQGAGELLAGSPGGLEASD
jgi:hydroxymethylbilane synthase